MSSHLSEKRKTLNRFYFGKPFKPYKGWKVVVIVSLWLLGCILLLMGITDLFRENIFDRINLLTYLLLVGSAIPVARICIAYFSKSKKA